MCKQCDDFLDQYEAIEAERSAKLVRTKIYHARLAEFALAAKRVANVTPSAQERQFYLALVSDEK